MRWQSLLLLSIGMLLTAGCGESADQEAAPQTDRNSEANDIAGYDANSGMEPATDPEPADAVPPSLAGDAVPPEPRSSNADVPLEPSQPSTQGEAVSINGLPGDNVMSIDEAKYSVASATFRYLRDVEDHYWDFEIQAALNEQNKGDDDNLFYLTEPRFYAEVSRLPLEPAEDMTGRTVTLASAWDEELNEPYFTLYLFEHGDVENVTLSFLEQRGNVCRIRITGTLTAGTVRKDACKLTIETWAERLPDGDA